MNNSDHEIFRMWNIRKREEEPWNWKGGSIFHLEVIVSPGPLPHSPGTGVKSFSRVRFCDSVDCSLPGSSIHGIFQARVLEWVAVAFSRRSSRFRDWTRVSRIVGRRFTIRATRKVLQEVKFRLISWRLASLERSEDLRRCPQVLCFSANYSWKVRTPISSRLLEEWLFS